jgi:hypothetical protein
MDGWCGEGFEELGWSGVNWKTKVQAGDGWRKYLEQAKTHNKGL